MWQRFWQLSDNHAFCVQEISVILTSCKWEEMSLSFLGTFKSLYIVTCQVHPMYVFWRLILAERIYTSKSFLAGVFVCRLREVTLAGDPTSLACDNILWCVKIQDLLIGIVVSRLLWHPQSTLCAETYWAQNKVIDHLPWGQRHASLLLVEYGGAQHSPVLLRWCTM